MMSVLGEVAAFAEIADSPDGLEKLAYDWTLGCRAAGDVDTDYQVPKYVPEKP